MRVSFPGKGLSCLRLPVFSRGLKKSSQELYGLICYGELRKKVGGCEYGVLAALGLTPPCAGRPSWRGLLSCHRGSVTPGLCPLRLVQWAPRTRTVTQPDTLAALVRLCASPGHTFLVGSEEGPDVIPVSLSAGALSCLPVVLRPSSFRRPTESLPLLPEHPTPGPVPPVRDVVLWPLPCPRHVQVSARTLLAHLSPCKASLAL